MFTDSARIVRSEGVLSRVLDGEAVLLDTDGGAYFGLNSVGTRAWEILATPGATRGSLIATLLREFEVTRDVLERDVDALLTGLEQRKLIHITP